MKKIVFSAAITAVFSLLTFSFIVSQQVSLETAHSPRALESSQGEESTVSNIPIKASSLVDWKTRTDEKDSSFVINSIESKKDPIEAFQSWSKDFMAGSGSELEGIRLAKIRRSQMAELIKNNPENAIANQIDADIREVLPKKIRQELEQVVHGRGQYDSQRTHGRQAYPHRSRSHTG